MSIGESMQQQAEQFRNRYQSVKEQVGRVIVGHDDVVHGVLTSMFIGGHVLLEGVPGLGKTLLVRTLAQALHLEASRVQFTPDLMPTDITGTNLIVDEGGGRGFRFQPGPIFANLVLADEINRATPKTQSALLEAMQEHRVTVARTSHVLEEPFFVLATQNPLESEGTYPLPEAQLDRFFFKLNVTFPAREELHAILDRTTGSDTPDAKPVASRADIITMQKLVRDVPVDRHVQDYAVRVLTATHPDDKDAPESVRRFVKFGGSP